LDFNRPNMDLNSFLDQAYVKITGRGANGRRIPVVGSSTGNIWEYFDAVNYAATVFSDEGDVPYAVLMHPEDKLRLEQEYSEITGVNLFANPEEAPNMYAGMILQPVSFVEKHNFLIVCEEDYKALQASNQDNLK